MCAPIAPKIPDAAPIPKPPDETATTFSTVKDEEDKLNAGRKKKGTQSLKITNKSPLSIPTIKSKVGLNIP